MTAFAVSGRYQDALRGNTAEPTEVMMTNQQVNVRGKAPGAIASFASGGLLFASGLMTVLLAISALFTNRLFLISPAWVFRLNFEAWGWIHLVLGLLMVLGAIAIMFRWTWARVAAIVLSLASMVLFFLWVPYYPVWSIVMIALDVVIIWAVTTWDEPTVRPPPV